MTYRLTLINAQNALSKDLFELIGYDDKPNWIVENRAAFITIENALSIEKIISLRKKLNSSLTDIFCTPHNPQKPKKLFLADMDSTIVTSETLDEMAEEAGLKEQISAITERAMQGELDFHAALKERVGMLKGLPANVLKRTLDQTQLSLGAKELVAALTQQNIKTVLVSGGFTYFTQAIADLTGFDHNHGNQLLIDNNQLTGEVGLPILDKAAKLDFLNQYVQQMDIQIGDTIAIGDGANDLPMLEAAGLGIGYRPKPLVAQTIPNCIIHTDLTSVKYLL